jgi:hypothetical protein
MQWLVHVSHASRKTSTVKIYAISVRNMTEIRITVHCYDVRAGRKNERKNIHTTKADCKLFTRTHTLLKQNNKFQQCQSVRVRARAREWARQTTTRNHMSVLSFERVLGILLLHL